MTIDENQLERSFRKEIEDKKILLTGGMHADKASKPNEFESAKTLKN